MYRVFSLIGAAFLFLSLIAWTGYVVVCHCMGTCAANTQAVIDQLKQEDPLAKQVKLYEELHAKAAKELAALKAKVTPAPPPVTVKPKIEGAGPPGASPLLVFNN